MTEETKEEKKEKKAQEHQLDRTATQLSALSWIHQTDLFYQCVEKWKMNPTYARRVDLPSCGAYPILIKPESTETKLSAVDNLRIVVGGSSEGVGITLKKADTSLILHIQVERLQRSDLEAKAYSSKRESGDSWVVLHPDYIDIRIRILKEGMIWIEDWFRITEHDPRINVSQAILDHYKGKTFEEFGVYKWIIQMGKELSEKAHLMFAEMMFKSIAFGFNATRTEVRRERLCKLAQACLTYSRHPSGVLRRPPSTKSPIVYAGQEVITQTLWSIYLYQRTHHRLAEDYRECVLQIMDFMLAFGRPGKQGFADLCKEEIRKPGAYYFCFDRPHRKGSQKRLQIVFLHPDRFLIKSDKAEEDEIKCCKEGHVTPTTDESSPWKACPHAVDHCKNTIDLFSA